MDKRTDGGDHEQGAVNSGSRDQWQALSDLELAHVGGGIGDTVL